MGPKELSVKEKIVTGISVRTNNKAESNPETAQLPTLWNRFFQQELMAKIPGKLPTSPVYGVYFDYESDFNGEYTTLAGVETDKSSENSEYSKTKIEAGKYLVFEGQGEMPQVVIDTWKEIWNYFSSLDAQKRAYATDFELYKGPSEVAIHIGVK